jgi:hypothetical protein
LLEAAIQRWHDFYVLLGTAAATLVGLSFVAATIGTGVLTGSHEAGLKAFITPTVVHFTAILGASLLVLVPFPSIADLGAVLLAEGVVGIVYSISVLLHIRHSEFNESVIFSDRVWYALVPIAAYVVLAAAALTLIMGRGVSLALLAGGLGLLLGAGIRNAWDMAVWIMMRPRG